MQSYVELKIDYLKRSKERIRALESDIECLSKRVPEMEKGEPESRCGSRIENLRGEIDALEWNVGEMAVSHSDSWEWTLEIEDTEWLFKVLKEHVDRARTVWKENKNDALAGENSELTETEVKG